MTTLTTSLLPSARAKARRSAVPPALATSLQPSASAWILSPTKTTGTTSCRSCPRPTTRTAGTRCHALVDMVAVPHLRCANYYDTLNLSPGQAPTGALRAGSLRPHGVPRLPHGVRRRRGRHGGTFGARSSPARRGRAPRAACDSGTARRSSRARRNKLWGA